MSPPEFLSRELSDKELAEYTPNRLRQEISDLLHELANARHPLSRPLAVRRLVGVAIEACELVADAAKSDAKTVKTLAAGLSHWPLNYSIFPGDEEAFPDYIRKLGLGEDSPISLKKWRLKAPGTRWAFAYIQLVYFCRAHFEICGKLPDGENRIVLFNGGQVLKLDALDAVALPPLSKERNVISKWAAAYRKHLDRYFVGNAILEHRDWQAYLARKSSLHSAGKQKAKILEMIIAGFRVIAKDG